MCVALRTKRYHSIQSTKLFARVNWCWNHFVDLILCFNSFEIFNQNFPKSWIKVWEWSFLNPCNTTSTLWLQLFATHRKWVVHFLQWSVYRFWLTAIKIRLSWKQRCWKLKLQRGAPILLVQQQPSLGLYSKQNKHDIRPQQLCSLCAYTFCVRSETHSRSRVPKVEGCWFTNFLLLKGKSFLVCESK